MLLHYNFFALCLPWQSANNYFSAIIVIVYLPFHLSEVSPQHQKLKSASRLGWKESLLDCYGIDMDSFLFFRREFTFLCISHILYGLLCQRFFLGIGIKYAVSHCTIVRSCNQALKHVSLKSCSPSLCWWCYTLGKEIGWIWNRKGG